LSEEKVARVSKLMVEAVSGYQPSIWKHIVDKKYDHEPEIRDLEKWAYSGTPLCKICLIPIEYAGFKNTLKELNDLSLTMTPTERNEAIEKFFLSLETKN
jgi:hypothetical protein